MKHRGALGIALLGTGLVVLSCSAERGSVPAATDADASVSMGSAAATRIAELRARFPLAVHAPEGELRFEAAAGPDAATHVRAVPSKDALLGVARSAHVALPVRADGDVKLEDDTSHLSVRFALERVRDARIEVAGGMALYRGALDGADVVHRVHAEGTEDFVVFETRPAREELSYAVDVSQVPGLRLVSNTLEFLDATGTPALRVAPPYVVDASGQRHEATLAVNGCAYDTNPAGPWGRTVTKPGAPRCTVRVVWTGLTYPAMVDPAWSATGSMAATRESHTATVLLSGKVLVAGGMESFAVSTAELYDPVAGTFAATGSMGVARASHTATLLPSGKVLVAGGSNSSAILASAELYDPAGNAGAGTFSDTGPMSTARFVHTASALPSGKVLVAGGLDTPNANAPLSSAELFDPSGNAGVGTFVATGSLATARAGQTASVLPSGKVLIAGGRGSLGALASAELFDPSGNAGVGVFVATGSMADMRRNHAAGVLPSGKVLVVGGDGLSSAELFDPAGNAGVGTFVATGSLAAVRRFHTASVLPSGRVLIVGGEGSGPTEMFDPAANAGAGAFDAAGPLATLRWNHTASVLQSGNVLVAGGMSLAPKLIQSAELFSFMATAAACAGAGECLSGFCADGFCCDSACNGGGCDRCDLAGKEGTCSVAPAGNPGTDPVCALPYACDGVTATCPTSCTSDTSCGAPSYCAANGTCQPRKPPASACNPQVSCKQPGCRECGSGFCVDGFCCDTACTGQCEACNSFAGTCGPIAGTPRGGRPACSAGSECSASTNRCESTCDGDHTTKSGNGTTQDCSPYTCDLITGACRAACSASNDCVAPGVCDPTGKCAPPPADASGGGGCNVAHPGAGGTGGQVAWLAAVMALVIGRRRRRNGSPAMGALLRRCRVDPGTLRGLPGQVG